MSLLPDMIGFTRRVQMILETCSASSHLNKTFVILIAFRLQDLAHYFHEDPEPGQEATACGGADILEALGKK